jgi:hypothetical protein
MTEERIAKLKYAIQQTDAIFAFEGFEPTPQKRAIDAAVLAGRVTIDQVIDEMFEYAREHKTTKGFIESRSWA